MDYQTYIDCIKNSAILNNPDKSALSGYIEDIELYCCNFEDFKKGLKEKYNKDKPSKRDMQVYTLVRSLNRIFQSIMEMESSKPEVYFNKLLEDNSKEDCLIPIIDIRGLRDSIINETNEPGYTAEYHKVIFINLKTLQQSKPDLLLELIIKDTTAEELKDFTEGKSKYIGLNSQFLISELDSRNLKLSTSLVKIIKNDIEMCLGPAYAATQRFNAYRRLAKDLLKAHNRARKQINSIPKVDKCRITGKHLSVPEERDTRFRKTILPGISIMAEIVQDETTTKASSFIRGIEKVLHRPKALKNYIEGFLQGKLIKSNIARIKYIEYAEGCFNYNFKEYL